MKNSYSLIKMGILVSKWNAFDIEDTIKNATYFNEQIENKINVVTLVDSENKVSIGQIEYVPVDIYIGFETPNEAYHLVVGNIGTFDIKMEDNFDIKNGSSIIKNIKQNFEKIDDHSVIVNAELRLLRSEDFNIAFTVSGDDISIRKKNVYIKFNWTFEKDFMIEVFNHETKSDRAIFNATVKNNNGISRDVIARVPFETILKLVKLKDLYNNNIVFDTVFMYRNIKLSKKTIEINPYCQKHIVSVVQGVKLLGYSVERPEKIKEEVKEDNKNEEK